MVDAMNGNSARRRDPASWWLDRAVIVATGLAIVSLLLEYGFEEPPCPLPLLLAIQAGAVALFVVQKIYRLIVAPDRWAALRHNVLDIVLIAVGAAVVILLLRLTSFPLVRAAAIALVVVQSLLAVRFIVGLLRYHLELSQTKLRPAMVLVTGFLGLIVIGGVLLSLPMSMSPELRHETGLYEAQRVLNCFFTSTSAVCVTGLVIYDTGRDYTFFGQCVILGLIQAGGLGIMIIGTLFGVLAGRNLSLRHSLTLQDSISHQTIGHLGRTVRFIVFVTLACELVGAMLLFPMWPADSMSLEHRIFASVFHAVSAFCNAGFALQGDNLVDYAESWPVYTSIMPLIIIGGLGFPVLSDIQGWIWHKLTGRRSRTTEILPDVPRIRRHGRPYHMMLHSKIVLATTALLIVLPVPFFLLFESVPDWRSRQQIEIGRLRAESEGNVSTMIDLPAGEKFLAALFQSVTTRTAGFNTVSLDSNSISPASSFLMCLLMFIGGSPGSTAGGVKTATFAVLILGVISTLRRRENLECAGRTIPFAVLRRASVVTIVMFLAVSLVALTLCYTESEALPEVLFETVSAFGTVGLSNGLTPRLTVAGRVIIMAAMFAGRLGPLTILVALAGRDQSARYEYPEEQPIIG